MAALMQDEDNYDWFSGEWFEFCYTLLVQTGSPLFDLKPFHWFNGDRLSAHNLAPTNMVNERVSGN